jgi:hypothetical protein
MKTAPAFWKGSTSTAASQSTQSRRLLTKYCLINLAILALLASIVPAFAITVATPENGAQLTSPFSLVASTISCGREPAVSMGYSLDYGATTIVSTSFRAMVVAGEGQHVLHVKCWGQDGANEDTPVNITIDPEITVPSYATVVSDIQSLPNWAWNHDPGTPGDSTGTSDLTNVPSLSGNARRISVSFDYSGGELYHVSFGKDTAATHFIYDAEVYLGNSSALANIEMDMNQVLANGNTVIYGVQCDGISGTWDYTLNLGTPDQPNGKWIHSNVPCPDPKTWELNSWHRVQISYSRDGFGNVTYGSIVLDGNQSDFVGANGNSAFALGWATTLLTNFQLDGLGRDGSITAYLDKLTVSRW